MSLKSAHYSFSRTPISSNRNTPLGIVVLIAQLLLGAVFIFSGLTKSIDPYGTAYKIEEYLHSFGLSANEGGALILSCLLCLFESLMGFITLSGFYRKVTSRVMFMVMLGMTLLTLYIMIANPVADCGCFGDALKISNTATFIKNLILMVPALLIVIWPHHMRPLLSPSMHLPATLIATLLFGHFIATSILHLPVIDFRPYKVGAKLSELKGVSGTAINKGGEDLLYVYSKDGEERTFTVDELTQVDSTWSYVRQEEVAQTSPTPTATAKGADFILIGDDGNDLTERLMDPERKAMIIITSEASKLTAKRLKKIDELRRIAERHGGKLILAYGNGSLPDQANKAADQVAHIDYTTGRTVVRSHPALVVIAGDMIVRKSAAYDLSKLVNSQSFNNAPFEPLTQSELYLRWTYRFGWLVVGALIFIFAALRHRPRHRNFSRW